MESAPSAKLRIEKRLSQLLYLIDLFVAALLVILAILGIASFLYGLAPTAGNRDSIESAYFTRLLDTSLWIFIVIELLKIAVAYLQGRRVMATVVEAGLVAVLRK